MEQSIWWKKKNWHRYPFAYECVERGRPRCALDGSRGQESLLQSVLKARETRPGIVGAHLPLYFSIGAAPPLATLRCAYSVDPRGPEPATGCREEVIAFIKMLRVLVLVLVPERCARRKPWPACRVWVPAPVCSADRTPSIHRAPVQLQSGISHELVPTFILLPSDSENYLHSRRKTIFIL